MRTFLLAVALISFGIVAAQDSIVRLDSRDRPIRFFLGGGVGFLNHFEMNGYLRKQDIVAMETREFNFTAGLAYSDKIIDIDLGYELFINGNSNGSTKNRTIANGIKLRALYKLVKIKDVELGAGFNIGYNRRKLSLYWKDYTVDLNNLPQGINGNQLTLFMEKAYLGPAIAVIYDGGKSIRNASTKVTLSYEIGLNNKIWEPQFFTLENQIKESRLTNLVLNVTFYL